MTKTWNQIIFFFLHQNQNIFFSNIGNQNIFLEKKHNPPFKLNGRSLRFGLYRILVYFRVQFRQISLYIIIVCRRAHVLFTLFVFVCGWWCPTHIVCVFLRLVCPMMPVSLDFPFFIVLSVFSNVY